jgi:hypothetical protein
VDWPPLGALGSKDNPLDTVGIGGVNTVLQARGARISGISADQQGNPSGYAFNADQRFPGDAANQLEAARLLAKGSAERYYTGLTKTVQTDAFNSADGVAQAAAAYASNVSYPATPFSGGLKLISKLASSTSPALGTRVYYISLGRLRHARESGQGSAEPAETGWRRPEGVLRRPGGAQSDRHSAGDDLVRVWSPCRRQRKQRH